MIKWLREAFAASMRDYSQFEPATPDFPDEKRGMVISDAALMESRRGGSPVVPIDQVFARAPAMRGVLPSGMAMDSMPATSAFAQFAVQGLYHEGLAFLGYPYLAQLTQRAEYRRASEIRAEHATRKWVKIKGPDDKVKAINVRLDELDARPLFREGLEKDGFSGRYHIFMDFGDNDDTDELQIPLEIDERKINPDRPLLALKGVEAIWCYPGEYNSTNPRSPDFYKPQTWYMNGDTVHDSRLLTFVGRPLPDMLKPAYAFGGLSLSQMAKPYVDNWLRTRQAVSDLVNSFSVMVLKTDMEATLSGVGGAEANLYRRVDMASATRNNRGWHLINKDSEEIESLAVPLSGLSDLQRDAMEQLCSVIGIPKIIWVGMKATGLGATSDDEVRVFYADIKSNEQERTCAPQFKRLLDVVQLSLFGAIDPDIKFEFEPLWEENEKDRAEADYKEAQTAKTYIDAGVISNDEDRERLAAQEDGMYHAVDLSGAAPELPEPDPVTPTKGATK